MHKTSSYFVFFRQYKTGDMFTGLFYKHISTLVLPEEDSSRSKRCKKYDKVLCIQQLITLFSHEYHTHNLRPERKVVQGLDYQKYVLRTFCMYDSCLMQAICVQSFSQ